MPGCTPTKKSGAVAKKKPTTPCGSTAKPCPATMVHASLDIIEITFAGNHRVEKDTQGYFGAPEWQKGRVAQDNSPVCYTRNNAVRLDAKFKVMRKPSAAETVEIKGQATFGSATIDLTGSGSVSPSDNEITVSGLTSAANLPNEVVCFDNVNIPWQANPGGSGWSPAGSSNHVFYVVLGDPSGTPAYWTLLDISCRAAHGQTVEAALVTHCFNPFKSRSLARKRDGHVLTYWNPNTTRATNTQQLLAQSNGSGQCGAWSEFLIDMYKCHGITSADKILVVRTLAAHSSATEGFLVKNWTFVGSGSGAAPWTHKMGTECQEQPGIPGQENPNPPPAFFNHFIVKYGSNLFDPSYGVGPVSTKLGWENGAIDGLFNDTRWTGFRKASHSSSNLLEFWNLRTGATI